MMKKRLGTVGLVAGLLLGAHLLHGSSIANFLGFLTVTAMGAVGYGRYRAKAFWLVPVLLLVFQLPFLDVSFQFRDILQGLAASLLVLYPFLLLGCGIGRLLQAPTKVRSWGFAIGLAALAVWGTMCWCGNPLAVLHGEKTGQAYLQEHYPTRDYYIEESGYGLEGYFVRIRSHSSADTRFCLYMDAFGDVKEDNYELYVAGGLNTEDRLRAEYRTYAQTVLEHPACPKGDYDCFASLHYLQQIHDPYGFGIPVDAFQLDEVFDLPGLSSEYGVISVSRETGAATPEEAAAYLQTLGQYLREQDFPFRAVDLEGKILLTAEDLSREDLAAHLQTALVTPTP